MFDQLFVCGAPVFLFRVIGRSPSVQPVDQFLADAGYLLFPVNIAQIWYDGDQSARSHASQVAISFHEHRICAASGSSQSGSDSSGAASDNNDIRFSADFNVSGRFCNRFSGRNGVHDKNLLCWRRSPLAADMLAYYDNPAHTGNQNCPILGGLDPQWQYLCDTNMASTPKRGD